MNSANLPDPGVIALEIAEDLEAALNFWCDGFWISRKTPSL
jgi:hypothetical protein